MIRYGPAGWEYRDWAGVVYPRPLPRGFDPLRWLAAWFDTVEVNATFYRPFTAEAALKWAARVEDRPGFRFSVKAWRRFTHEREAPPTPAEIAEGRAPLDALREAGRLGAVLVQFPWSFKRSVESEEWLGGVFQALAGLPLVLEVRHASWEAPDFLAELAERAVGIVNVDQPMFSRSIAPAARVTAAVAYVRVHGRNFRDWFREGAGRDARYDYLYRADELRPWAARVKQLDADPSRPDVYVVTNNHFEGKAVANARMLEAMVRGKKVGAPAPLLDRYAKVLGPYAVPEDGPPPAPPGRTAPPAQGTLF
ncbi:MAG: DUF72 domain-containing protein [Anaeromyxobacter sp.]